MTIKRKQKKEKVNFFVIFSNKKIRYALVIILACVLFFFKKMISLYVVFTAMTAIIVYYSKLWHIPIDVSPLFFLGVVITRYYGFQYMMLFYLVAYLIPKTLTGHTANWLSYIFISISWLSFLFVYIAPGSMSLQTMGYLTSIIQFVLSAMFQTTMKPLLISIADGVGNVLNNLIWFLIFSDLIVFLMG
ncbi:hypothetical protein JXC34_07275 [Candidatus Woesearchaeota archaeon]|nr:hypothetical protein [Candidatus Woesearchaeota archaeon]